MRQGERENLDVGQCSEPQINKAADQMPLRGMQCRFSVLRGRKS